MRPCAVLSRVANRVSPQSALKTHFLILAVEWVATPARGTRDDAPPAAVSAAVDTGGRRGTRTPGTPPVDARTRMRRATDACAQTLLTSGR